MNGCEHVSPSQTLSQNQHQVVATTSIDDGSNTVIIDDEENME
jgi:hypothetical protein